MVKILTECVNSCCILQAKQKYNPTGNLAGHHEPPQDPLSEDSADHEMPNRKKLYGLPTEPENPLSSHLRLKTTGAKRRVNAARSPSPYLLTQGLQMRGFPSPIAEAVGLILFTPRGPPSQRTIQKRKKENRWQAVFPWSAFFVVSVVDVSQAKRLAITKNQNTA